MFSHVVMKFMRAAGKLVIRDARFCGGVVVVRRDVSMSSQSVRPQQPRCDRTDVTAACCG